MGNYCLSGVLFFGDNVLSSPLAVKRDIAVTFFGKVHVRACVQICPAITPTLRHGFKIIWQVVVLEEEKCHLKHLLR